MSPTARQESPGYPAGMYLPGIEELVSQEWGSSVSEFSFDEWLKELEPEDGWWKSYTEDAIREVFRDLTGAGCPPQMAANSIESIMEATRGEYGD